MNDRFSFELVLLIWLQEERGMANSQFLYSSFLGVLNSRPNLFTSRLLHRTPYAGRCFGHSRISKSSRSHTFCGTRMSSSELETSFVVKKKAAEVSDELKGTSIFLLGMNCPIKSNLGKVLADELKYYYFDSDSLVEQAIAGDPAAKSFQERDGEIFRKSESEVLKQLSSMGRLVVCVGDGAVQSSTNLAFLRHGISLWIEVPLDYLAKNVCIANGSEVDFETPQTDDLLLKMDYLSARYSDLKGGYETADATVSLLKVASRLRYDDFSSVSSEDMAVQAFMEIEKLTRLRKMIEAAAKPF